MAVKSLYFKNVTVNGALSLQDGGTAPTGALTTTGWTMAKLATPQHSIMAVGTKKASGTFAAADALATPTFTAASCWRSEQPFNGTFAATNFSMAFRIRCSLASSQTGAVKVRLWKSTNATGTGATQLTSSVLVGTTTPVLSTTASQTSTVTWTSDAVPHTFTNEYLWVQCEWSIVATAGSNSADAVFYVESAGVITTPNFVNQYQLTADKGTYAVAGKNADLDFDRQLNADKGSYSYNGRDVGVPIYTPWTAFQADLTAVQLSESTSTGPHYVTRSYTFIVGDSYQFSIDYKPNGPNPRGIWLIANLPYGPNSSSISVTGSNTGIETGSGFTSGYWTLDQHSITSTANGYFKALVKGTYIEPDQVSRTGDLQIYLYATTNSYTGDGTSGFAFENYKGLHYSRFIAESGSYGITGNDVEFIFTPRAAQHYTLTADTGNYSIVVDIANLNLGDLITCTRASTGYSQTEDGTLVQFAANQPRITDLGLLVEDARTNLIARSQEIADSAWPKTAVTVTADAVVAPDGTLTADTVSDNPTNSTHSVSKSCGVSSGVTYTCSIYAKAGTGSWLQMHVVSGSSFYANFNLATGATGLNAGTTAINMEPLADGWYRCSITGSVGSTTATGYFFSLPSDTASTGYLGANATRHLWGAQLEQASFASSYIPTTTASATRAADVTTTAGSLDTLLTANVCSVVLDMKAPGTVNLQDKNGGSHWIQSATGQMMVGTDYNFQNTKPNSRWSSMLVGNDYGNSRTLAGGVKVGVSWDAVADTLSLVGGGGVVGTMSMPGAVPLATPVYIGRGLYTATHYFGYFRRLTVWNIRLVDATLQGLTDLDGPTDYNIDLDFSNNRYGAAQPSVTLIYTANPNKILNVDSGTYNITGNAADLDYGHRVIALKGAYNYSGQAATLRFGHRSFEVKGAYSYSGQAATLQFGHRVIAAQGVYAVVGKAATLQFGHKFAAAQGSYAVAGSVATLISGRRVIAVQGAYAVSGRPNTFLWTHKLVAAQGAYSVTGRPNTFLWSHKLIAEQGVYAIAGKDPILRYTSASNVAVSIPYGITGQPAKLTATHKPLIAAQGAYSVIGRPAVRGYSTLLAKGSYAISGKIATLRYGRIALAAASGVYASFGRAATLTQGRRLIASQGVYSVTGWPTVGGAKAYTFLLDKGSYAITGRIALRAYGLSLARGSYAVAGKIVTTRVQRSLASAKGLYAVIGNLADLRKVGSYSFDLQYGPFVLTGNAVKFIRTVKFLSNRGSYSLTGNAAGLRRGLKLNTAIGSYDLVGQAISLQKSYKFSAAKGAYVSIGNPSTKIHEHNLIALSRAYAITGQPAGSKRRYQSAVASGVYSISETDADLFEIKHGKMAADRGRITLSGSPVTFLLTNSRSDSYGVVGSPVTFIRSFRKYGAEIEREHGTKPTLIPQSTVHVDKPEHEHSTPVTLIKSEKVNVGNAETPPSVSAKKVFG